MTCPFNTRNCLARIIIIFSTCRPTYLCLVRLGTLVVYLVFSRLGRFRILQFKWPHLLLGVCPRRVILVKLVCCVGLLALVLLTPLLITRRLA